LTVFSEVIISSTGLTVFSEVIISSTGLISLLW